ncbi:MAG TPA: hypothetical protein PLC12_00060, partial [Candidatus Methanofastidiosa archaeon]|nr:hypothetical protein [Candidatus Methanofastidiosa archaeon]
MELSRDARILFALIFVLFLQSYLSGNVLPSLLGIGVLSYILFCRSSFAAAVDSQDVNIQRNIQKKTYFAKEPVRVSVSYSYPFTDEVFLEIKDRIPKDSFVLEGSNVHTDVVSSLRGI